MHDGRRDQRGGGGGDHIPRSGGIAPRTVLAWRQEEDVE